MPCASLAALAVFESLAVSHVLTILGCSGGIGPGLKTTTLLLDDHTLIDAGTGLADLDLAAQRALRRVFLTHAHLDHVCGLALLADNRFDTEEGPLVVYARPETLETLQRHLFNWQLWPDFSRLPHPEQAVLRWQAFPVGEQLRLAPDLVLHSLPAHHTVPACGYALVTERQVLAFSGDTSDGPAFWAALNALPRLDRLIIEVAFPDEQAELGELSRHFTPRRLGSALGQLRHRPELLLTHHKPGQEARIEAQCRAALAGWRFRSLQPGERLPL